MRRTILAIAAAAMALTVGLTGAALAATSSGTEHFSLASTSFSSNSESIIATGAFTAGGTDLSGNKVDKVKFPGGTFKIAHKGPSKGSLNPKTCLETITGTGKYTLSGGTGAYKGISGSGTYKLSIELVANRASNGKCSMNVAPRRTSSASWRAGRSHSPKRLTLHVGDGQEPRSPSGTTIRTLVAGVTYASPRLARRDEMSAGIVARGRSPGNALTSSSWTCTGSTGVRWIMHNSSPFRPGMDQVTSAGVTAETISSRDPGSSSGPISSTRPSISARRSDSGRSKSTFGART